MKVRLMHPAVGEFSFPVPKVGQVVLGRKGAGVDVEVSWDARISRVHARIWLAGDRLWFEDLGSRNGSWIGDDRLTQPVSLGPGESLIVGETALLVPEAAEEDTRQVESTVEAGPKAISEALAAAIAQVGLPSMLGALPITASGGTADLQMFETLPPGPAVAIGRASAKPILLDGLRVMVRCSEPSELSDLWERDISKGGLFVETDRILPPATKLEVRIESPDGVVTLSGQVVHVVTRDVSEASGAPQGVGLQLLDLTPAKKKIVQDYVEGAARKLSGTPPAPRAPSTSLGSGPKPDEVLVRVKKLLEHAEREALYAAVDVYPNAPTPQILQKIEHLRSDIRDAMTRATPPQAARFDAALAFLFRTERILSVMEARLEYDFRAGHIRAQERIAQANARTGPALPVLRRIWNRVAPERVEQAAMLTRKAFSARQNRDIPGAIDAGKQALQLNPFFDELQKTVSAWELLV